MQLSRVVEIASERAAVRNLAAGYQIEGVQLMEKIKHTRTAARNPVNISVKAAVPCHDVALVRILVLADKSARAAHCLSCSQTVPDCRLAAPAVEASVLDNSRIILVAEVFVYDSNARDRIRLNKVDFTAVLPHAEIVTLVATFSRPVREPDIMAVPHLGRNEVVLFLKSGINHRIITRFRDAFEKNLADTCDVCAVPAAVTGVISVGIFHVKRNGQQRFLAPEQSENMRQLTACRSVGAGVAVEIYTPRYACRLAFADVFLPVCVVLFGDILAEAGADHDEIITRVLDFFNADLAVVGADINALAVFEVDISSLTISHMTMIIAKQ